MVTIQQGDLFTLVNVFTVTPDKQQQVIDILVEAGEQTMKHLPGFVSSNLHKSDDGKYVINYVQWRRREDFDTMMKNPEAKTHRDETAALSVSYNPIICEVVASIEV